VYLRRRQTPPGEIRFTVEDHYGAKLSQIASESRMTVPALAAKILREWLLMRPTSVTGRAAADAEVPASPAAWKAARTAGVTAMQDGLVVFSMMAGGPGPQAFNKLAREISDAALGAALVAIARGEA
jgi:hypothetical protein